MKSTSIINPSLSELIVGGTCVVKFGRQQCSGQVAGIGKSQGAMCVYISCYFSRVYGDCVSSYSRPLHIKHQWDVFFYFCKDVYMSQNQSQKQWSYSIHVECSLCLHLICFAFRFRCNLDVLQLCFDTHWSQQYATVMYMYHGWREYTCTSSCMYFTLCWLVCKQDPLVGFTKLDIVFIKHWKDNKIIIMIHSTVSPPWETVVYR